MKTKATWTALDEQQAEAYADAVMERRNIHRCGGEIFYMGGRRYECLSCGWMSRSAPDGVPPRRWQHRAEND